MEPKREIAVCFSGHREIPAGMSALVRTRLDAAIERLMERGFTEFIVGGALGFDLYAAKAVLSHPGAALFVVLPCPLTARGEAAYRSILPYAYVTLLSDHYTRDGMLYRNRYMVDRSSALIAYQTKDTGGTAYTVAYANRCGVPVLHLTDGRFLDRI